jgi:hypothetical protein
VSRNLCGWKWNVNRIRISNSLRLVVTFRQPQWDFQLRFCNEIGHHALFRFGILVKFWPLSVVAMNSVAVSEFAMKWTVWCSQIIQWREHCGTAGVYSEVINVVLSDFAMKCAVVRLCTEVISAVLPDYGMKWTVWPCQNLQWSEQCAIVRLCNEVNSVALPEFAMKWTEWHCQIMQWSEQSDTVRLCN